LLAWGNNIHAYDVSKNMDIFFVDMPDGAFSIIYGILYPLKQKLIFVGGNCSLKGLD